MSKKTSIHISVDERNSINWVLKKFKRECESFGIVKEYRKRKAHRKPSIKEKEKREAAEKRRSKELRRRGSRRTKI